MLEIKTYIESKEILGNLAVTDIRRFDQLARQFKPLETSVTLMNASVLLAFGDLQFNKVFTVSGVRIWMDVFAQHLLMSMFLQPSTLEKLMQPQFVGRPAFFRTQLLWVLKKIILLGETGGTRSPPTY